MRVVGDDWLSSTIRTVEYIMEQHGFVEDVAPPINPPLSKQTNTLDWNKLFQRFNLLRLS